MLIYQIVNVPNPVAISIKIEKNNIRNILWTATAVRDLRRPKSLLPCVLFYSRVKFIERSVY